MLRRRNYQISVKSADTKYTIEVKDCVLGMRGLPEDSVDLVVTSPPYNLGIKYKKYEDNKSRQEYLDWCREWARGIKRVLKPGGSFFLNVGASPSDPLMPHELIIALLSEDVGFRLQNTFHWIKSISVHTRQGEELSVGHFKPINSKRFVNDCHEFIFHLTRAGDVILDRLAVGVQYSDKSNINRWSHTKGRDKRCRGNNWFIPYETIVNRVKDRPHPATFPVALAVNCIKVHGCDSKSVMLDPFLGIGHSAVAAKECGIGHFIGFDIDEDYLSVARWAIFGAPDAATVEAHKKTVKTWKGNDGEKLLFETP